MSHCFNIKQFINTVTGLCVEVSFQCCLMGGYQKSMHYQDVTNYCLLTRHFIMQGSILQRTSTASLADNQQVRQYIYLQTTQLTDNNQEVNNNSQLSQLQDIHHCTV
jgi:hypothetical protein